MVPTSCRGRAFLPTSHSLQGRRQKMVPRVPPVFWLWNQHAQLHCLGTHKSYLGRQTGECQVGGGGDTSLGFFLRCWIVIQSANILAGPSVPHFGQCWGIPERTQPQPQGAPGPGYTDILILVWSGKAWSEGVLGLPREQVGKASWKRGHQSWSFEGCIGARQESYHLMTSRQPEPRGVMLGSWLWH